LAVAPKDKVPVVYGFMIQIYMDMGQYEKCRDDISAYKKLGGKDDLVQTYDLMLRALDRQISGINLPPNGWQPPGSYGVDLTMNETAGPWLQQLCVGGALTSMLSVGDKPRPSVQERELFVLGAGAQQGAILIIRDGNLLDRSKNPTNSAWVKDLECDRHCGPSIWCFCNGWNQTEEDPSG